MIFVKSVFAGIVAVFVFVFAFALMSLIVVSLVLKAPDGAAVGWDPVSLVRQSPLSWLLLTLAFSAGFIWKYRRLTRRST